MSIINDVKDKSILIWGYGREGKSTERFLKELCQAEKVDIFEGKLEDINEDAYDLIIKSPGIVMEESRSKYTSQTELFLQGFSEKIVGITGTKGKSTTSSLLYHVLKECSGKKVLLVGNIGKPCLDYYEEIDDNTIIVFEMSCHQLAHTKVSPHVAVFLNIFEEHLDYYGTFEKYYGAKCNITNYQKEDDYLFVGDNLPKIDTKAKVQVVQSKTDYHYDLKLLGEHNQFNAKIVDMIATEIFGCDSGKVAESMKAFRGLPHRMEYAGTVEGVSYYDDSISTIPEATISAVHSISNVQTVLVGGMDRNIHYESLVEFIKATPQVQFICMYASGQRIYQEVEHLKNCYYVLELKEAVELAKKITSAGHACVLSPAAASYGYFKDFEERGDVFQGYVREAMV